MPNLPFSQLLARSQEAEMDALQRTYFRDTPNSELPERLKDFNESIDVIKSLMTAHTNRQGQVFGLKTGEGRELWQGRERGEFPLLSLKEALLSNDASILFKRVISDVLMMPTETIYIGQDYLSQKVTVDGVRSVMFPTMGALTAGAVSENGAYPQRSPSFNMEQMELRVKKWGLQIEVGEDLIEDAMWDIFGLLIGQARDAMKRLKEENIFIEAFLKAHVVFDNASGNSAGYTSGTSPGTNTTPGNKNGTIGMLDILDMAGALMGNGYTPTDLVVHPLAWVMLAKDPRLQFNALMSGNYNQSMPTPGLDPATIKSYLPWGLLNIVVSPQMPFKFHTVLNMGNGALGQSNLTDFLMLDRQKSLVVVQRDEMHVDEFEHPERDIKIMRIGERYVVGAIDGARSLVQAKNLRISDHNSTPVYSVGMSAPV